MNRREFLTAAAALPMGLSLQGEVPAKDMTASDVLIAGGGPAGLACAITFARQGKRVQLVESHGCLGGIWTSGLLSCLIDFDKCDLAREITARLDKLGARVPRRATMLDSNYLYEPEYMKYVCEEMCRESDVQFQLFTTVTSAEVKGRQITAVVTHSKSGFQRWTAPIFVDATGDGDLAALAGCGYDIGGEQPGAPDQPASLIALMTCADDQRLAPFTVNDASAFDAEGKSIRNSKLAFLQELRRVGVEPSYAAPTLFRIRHNLFAVMANHEYELDLRNAAAVTAATCRARKELVEMTLKLAAQGGSAWEGVRLITSAEQIGHRAARRIHGRYTLTREDIVEGRRFPDAIAQCGFCMDVHTTRYAERKDGQVITHPTLKNKVKAARVYDIPLRACQAKDRDNLYMVGRCISGSFVAQSSYRVSGTAVAMGAGLARKIS